MTRAHAAALTPFIGWSAEQLARADEDGGWAWEEVHRRLHDWARMLRGRGVASLLATITAGEGLPARVLAVQDGERQLTDLRHIGQLLHAAATDEQLGATALTGWLRPRIAEAGHDTGDEERSRRLESDAEAVQVLTIHRSKGLEFPIVYLPFLWEPGWIPDRPQPPVFFHDPHAGDARTIDCRTGGARFHPPSRPAHDRAARRGPAARLRRADPRPPPGGRLVGGLVGQPQLARSGGCCSARDADGNVAADGRSTPTDQAFGARLRRARRRRAGTHQRGARDARDAERVAPAAATEVARAERYRVRARARLRWRRTSYSDITAGSPRSVRSRASLRSR